MKILMTIVLQLSEVLHSIGLTENLSDKKKRKKRKEKKKKETIGEGKNRKEEQKKQLAAYLAPMSKFEGQVKLIEKETEESN